MQSEYEVLTNLAHTTLEYLKSLPQPITRVCGPLTTGGFGYEANAERLIKAEEILSEKGYTIFRFGDAETSIQNKGYLHESVMNLFHLPILQSGLIANAFFLPGWNESKGALIERELCEKYGITIEEFPEEWF